VNKWEASRVYQTMGALNKVENPPANTAHPQVSGPNAAFEQQKLLSEQLQNNPRN